MIFMTIKIVFVFLFIPCVCVYVCVVFRLGHTSILSFSFLLHLLITVVSQIITEHVSERTAGEDDK